MSHFTFAGYTNIHLMCLLVCSKIIRLYSKRFLSIHLYCTGNRLHFGKYPFKNENKIFWYFKGWNIFEIPYKSDGSMHFLCFKNPDAFLGICYVEYSTGMHFSFDLQIVIKMHNNVHIYSDRMSSLPLKI